MALSSLILTSSTFRASLTVVLVNPILRPAGTLPPAHGRAVRRGGLCQGGIAISIFLHAVLLIGRIAKDGWNGLSNFAPLLKFISASNG